MKKKLIRLLSFIFVISLLCVSALAAETWGSMSLAAESGEVTAGDQITLTVALDDCSALEGGVKNFKATVTVPEGLSVESVTIDDSFASTTGIQNPTYYVSGNTVTISANGNAAGSYSGTAVAIAVITCKAEKYGTYTIALEGSLTDSKYATQTPAVIGTTVTVKCNHSYDEGVVTTPATCVKEGVKTYTCSICSDTYTESIHATGVHIYDKGTVTAPTCTEQGYTTYKCENCDASHTADYVAAAGHAWDDGVVTKEPTEDAVGEMIYTCTVCKTTRTASIPEKDHEHKYESVVTAPTCTEQGYTTYTCTCGDSYVGDYVAANGHTEVEDEAVAATCVKDGLTAGKHCSVCGEVLAAQEVVPATGKHTYADDYATSCSVCGYTPMVAMYRLYNPYSGEHFYTGSEEERDHLDEIGWDYEGIGWYAPVRGGVPIYRLYNPNNGDHHYTGSQEEVNNLIVAGWNYEGVAWNSPLTGTPVYRLYNPNADCGSHHYTCSAEERDYLDEIGWDYEGIAWNGLKMD